MSFRPLRVREKRERELEEVLRLIGIAFDIEITIGKHTFKIPHDIEIGPNWGSLEKVKK